MNTTWHGFGRFGTLLAGIGILVSVLVVTAVVGDLREVRDLWNALSWQYFIGMILLAVVNHGLRYWRWEVLLKRVSSIDFKRSTAIILFASGSLLIFTPARMGEVAKSVYARDFFGIPMATSLPILITERLADVVVMALLASLGLLLLRESLELWLAGIILGTVLLVFVFRKPFLGLVSRWRITRLLGGTSAEQTLSLASESQLSLFAPPALGISLAFGTTAWTTEVIIYFLSLGAVGITMNPHLLVLALAVFPLASLVGSVSFLPGGLGVTEGGLVALGILLGGLSEEPVILAALLSRAAILGIVVLVGIVSLLLLHRIKSL